MNRRPDNQPISIEIVVPDGAASERLDAFLGNCKETNITRSKAQKLITNGLVSVNDDDVSKSYKVQPGDVVAVTIPPEEHIHLVGEDLPLEIAYEDEHLVVVNKVAGMVTHPAVGNPTGTLVNALIYRFGKMSQIKGNHRPGIVHRLDKDTSGLLVVAKNDVVFIKLQEMMQAREISRKYKALVVGHMNEDEGEIDVPIGRSPKDRQKMGVVSEERGGRAAVTRYQLLKRYRVFDLLDVSLVTGRTHQIRVHMAHMAHPVFGDADYGGRDKILKGIFAPERPLVKELLEILPRQALHAYSLEFIHPVTGEKVSFQSELPGDYAQVIERLEE
jgi:23S rRNA pseudouridine1911/1915/1917 synthase